jgi:transposase
MRFSIVTLKVNFVAAGSTLSGRKKLWHLAKEAGDALFKTHFFKSASPILNAI